MKKKELHRLLYEATQDRDKAYHERNLLAQAFAHLAHTRHWPVGMAIDPKEPNWPVLLVETPLGQVSWHLYSLDVEGNWPAYPGTWDGHTTETKNQRLKDLLASPELLTAVYDPPETEEVQGK